MSKRHSDQVTKRQVFSLGLPLALILLFNVFACNAENQNDRSRPATSPWVHLTCWNGDLILFDETLHRSNLKRYSDIGAYPGEYIIVNRNSGERIHFHGVPCIESVPEVTDD